MYFRMLFLMLISFYSSRVVLRELGVNDFGIYNLVGSVVAMFSSLKTIFATSTQRFINYEIGKKNYRALKSIFNTSLLINAGIAICFVVIVEIVGYWFLNYKIQIQPDRLFAAKCVFQFSLLSAVVSIITSTFDAEVIAHEKMNFYAYLSIFESILKLAIVFVLPWFNFDILIFYGMMIMAISFVALAADYIYCRNSFEECRLTFRTDKAYLKEMTKFAGWNFLGTNAYILAQNGINMILNVFGGPVVNAARGIAYQVNGAINQFISNIVIVVNPYCVKSYAEGNMERTFSIINSISKILIFVQYLIMIPLIIWTEWILKIWLGIVPEYSAIFLRLILIYSFVRSLHPPIDILFKAHGNLKIYQICEGLILLLPLLISYCALKAGANIASVFVIMILFDVVNLFAILYIVNRQTGFPINEYFKKVLIPCSVLFIVVTVSVTLSPIDLGTIALITLPIIIDILSIIYFYVCGISKNERITINKIIRKYICRR